MYILKNKSQFYNLLLDSSTTIKQLHLQTHPDNLFFPLFLNKDQSIEDIINEETITSLSFRYGKLADNILGINLALSSGKKVQLGSRVVKNVTGFDFVRFLCNSQQRLGSILDVVLRLRPWTGNLQTLTFSGPMDLLHDLAHKLAFTSFSHSLGGVDVQISPEQSYLKIFLLKEFQINEMIKIKILKKVEEEYKDFIKQIHLHETINKDKHIPHDQIKIKVVPSNALPLIKKITDNYPCFITHHVGLGFIRIFILTKHLNHITSFLKKLIPQFFSSGENINLNNKNIFYQKPQGHFEEKFQKMIADL